MDIQNIEFTLNDLLNKSFTLQDVMNYQPSTIWGAVGLVAIIYIIGLFTAGRAVSHKVTRKLQAHNQKEYKNIKSSIPTLANKGMVDGIDLAGIVGATVFYPVYIPLVAIFYVLGFAFKTSMLIAKPISAVLFDSFIPSPKK